jgi:hypothetical protein
LHASQIWAGSDTCLIHLTTDSGKNWHDVTPPGLSDWSKIAMIEPSHFNASEAFVAVDRHRLDDQAPYLFRTRDFGKTWQPINHGIADHAFLRSVREDPKKSGLLFAGTERGIYVSFDDGDHWQPLQLNLPTTSVYDITIHDDDLVIATHGRSIWILDDIAPLREVASHTNTEKVWLFSAADAYRVDNDSFLGTPLPPEEPQAKNPPDGAFIDYYLQSPADNVKLEIVDGAGHLVRRYQSGDKPRKHMVLPIAERWFPEPVRLEKTAGMHRFVWDLRSSSSGDTDAEDASDEPTAPKGPRVVAGTYQLKLTVNDATFTQNVVVKMDPRSSATPDELTEQYRLGQQMFATTLLSRQALAEMNAVTARLDALQPKLVQNPELMARVSVVQVKMKKLLDDDSESKAWGLKNANTGLAAALKVVEGGNRTVPSQALALYDQANQAFQQRVSEWHTMKASDLPQLNQELEKAGITPIKISQIQQYVEELMTQHNQ